jgi:hypothetical protein
MFSRVPDSRYLFVEFAECSHRVELPDTADRGVG